MLLADYVFRPRYELYDLQHDPDEIVNLADSLEHKAVFNDFAERLKECQKKTRDPWFVKHTDE